MPNDERGSWSEVVRVYELYQHGPATKTDARCSVARKPFDRNKRDAAKAELKYGTITLNGIQARAVARGFARAVEESKYQVLACAIMPDHVHQVIVRCQDRKIERIIGHMKARATQQLIAEELHPLIAHKDADGTVPSMWVEHGWNVYLNTDEEIEGAIRYVRNNPMKSGLKEQHWNFVQGAV